VLSYLSNFSADKPFVIQTSPSGSSGNAFRIEANSRRDVLVGLNSYPSAPGSYSYANGSLAVAGDMWLGSASNVYRSLITGGGNSSGALFGNFPVQGDGLNLSYNYLVDSTNTARIPNTGGETSLIQTGYGSVKLKAGATNTAPSTKVYLYQNRLAIGKGDGVADSTLEVQSSSSDDIFKCTNTAGQNILTYTNAGTLQLKNSSGVVNFQFENAGSSGEYGNIYANGWIYLYPHVQIGTTTPIMTIPSDTGESMRLNGINLHVGSSSNTDSGFAFQTTGKAKITQGLIINSSAGDNDTQIQGDTDANLFYADASTDRIGVGTNSPASKLAVNGTMTSTGVSITDTNLSVTLGGAPSTASSSGDVGTIKFDTNYMYVCTATNTWKRVAMSSW
jgi:hypothetical protein